MDGDVGDPDDADDAGGVDDAAGRPTTDETTERRRRARTLPIDIVDPASEAARVAVAAYMLELDGRLPGGFAVCASDRDETEDFRYPHGVFVVARDRAFAAHTGPLYGSDTAPAGGVAACGAVRPLSATTGELKRMWVAPEWRGVRLGQRLLLLLEQHAVRLGLSRLRLDTHAVLSEAISLYEATGYRPIEPYNDNRYAHHWLEKSLGR